VASVFLANVWTLVMHAVTVADTMNQKATRPGIVALYVSLISKLLNNFYVYFLLGFLLFHLTARQILSI